MIPQNHIQSSRRGLGQTARRHRRRGAPCSTACCTTATSSRVDRAAGAHASTVSAPPRACDVVDDAARSGSWRPIGAGPGYPGTPQLQLVLDSRSSYNNPGLSVASLGRFCAVYLWPVFKCPPRGKRSPFSRSVPGVWVAETDSHRQRGAVRRPAQNGRHERMHRTLKGGNDAAGGGEPGRSTAPLQRLREEFNTQRPHEPLDQPTPAACYAPSPRPMPDRVPPLEYPDRFEIRYVSANGGIRWASRWVNVFHRLHRGTRGLGGDR